MINVSELVNTINDSGLSLEEARKEGLLPANVKAIRKLLKENGYDYDRASKQWRTGMPAPNIASFTEEEIRTLKQLAHEITRGNTGLTAITSDNTNDRYVTPASADITLYERSRTLEKGNTIRKTYVIDDDIANRFDTLSDRSNIDRSQLLLLALADFLDKYNG